MNNKLLDVLMAVQHTKTEKQQRVIESAIRLFAERGYANTSTAEIAKAAGVSEGIIFKHYGTKDKLLLSIVLSFVKDALPHLAHEVFTEVLTVNTTSFEHFLSELLKNRVKFIHENKAIFRVFVKEIFYKDEFKKEIIPFLPGHIVPLLIKVVEQFKERGQLIDKPADQIINVLATYLGGFFVSRFVLFDDYTVSDEEIEYVVRFAMDGLRNPTSDPA